MKRLAKRLALRKQKIIVYSGTGEDGFPSTARYTTDEDELERWLSMPENFRSFVMLDEAAVLVEDIYPKKDYKNIHQLFQKGRHKGYTNFMATQFPTSVPKKWRVNCGECFCFALGSEEDAKAVWADFNRLNFEGEPLWKVIMGLDKLEFLHITRPDKIEKLSL